VLIGSVISTPTRARTSRNAELIPIRELTNKPAVDQPATFSFGIQFLSFASCHVLLHHKRVVVIRPPLLMKWRNTKTAAIGDNIANLLRPYRTRKRAAFAPRY
jgi:hypothetical protein